MNLSEYAACDATELARMVRDSEVTAAELQDLARAGMAEVNPQINAIADGPWDEPLAHDANGRFAGVPFVLKDLVTWAAGVPTRCGSRLTGDGVTFDHDTHLVERFREAGLAILALTTTPEFGYNANSEALAYGPTRNPWDTSRSAGGSSGGTGALVASGAVPFGHATDGGGSIRTPAACNGLVGLKASRGRVPDGPDNAEVLYGIATELGLFRTVRDCAALLDAVTGPAPGDKVVIRPPARPYVEEVGAEPRRLRVAVHTTSWSPKGVDPEVVAAVEAVAAQLESLGHQVDVAGPPVDFDELMDANVKVWTPYFVGAVASLSSMSGLEAGPDTLEHTTFSVLEHGRTVTAAQLNEGLAVYNATSRAIGAFFEDHDLLLTPTMNTPALPLGVLDANDTSLDAVSWTHKIFDAGSFALPFNISGTPAMSLPLGVHASGLPIGVQLAAPMCDEATLFQVAAVLEQAIPWADRRPAVHVGNLVQH